MTTWNLIPDTLPPRDEKAPMQGRWSQHVWLALNDGRVVIGQCLHWDEPRRPVGAKSVVSAWYIDDPVVRRIIQYHDSPLAWLPIEVPQHPWSAT